MKHKRDDGPEKHEDEAVDVTPVMICVFVVMCCSMLVLLYHFYDQLGGCPAPALRAAGEGGVQGPRQEGPGATPSFPWGGHPARECGTEPSFRLPSPPAPPRSLRHHRHLLPGLLHGPLQLPVTAPPEAAVLQMQVSPRATPTWPCSRGSPSAALWPVRSHLPLPGPRRLHSFAEAEDPCPPEPSVSLARCRHYSRCPLRAGWGLTGPTSSPWVGLPFWLRACGIPRGTSAGGSRRAALLIQAPKVLCGQGSGLLVVEQVGNGRV